MEKRICRVCGLEKPITEFNKNGKYYRTNCKECKKIYEKNQYVKNREKVLQRCKIHDQLHSEERKEYRRKNKEHIQQKNRQYYVENSEKIKEYRKKHAEEISKAQKIYRENNRELIIKLRKEYYKKNPHYHRDYDKNRMEIDEIFKFKKIVRNMIKMSFNRKGLRKSKKTNEIIGCDFTFFQEYLLNTYKTIYGIEWDGVEEVHIDHIIPLATAKTEDEVIKLCHYTNLQLLKAKDNIEKSNKLDWKLNNE